REAELIAPHGEKQIYGLTSKGNSWLHWPPASQAMTLFAAWRDGTTWAEMYNDPLLKASDYRPTETLLRIRHAALDALAESGAEAFFEIGSLTDTLAYRYPLLL